MQKTAFTKNN